MLSLQGRVTVLGCHALQSAILLFDELESHHQPLAMLTALQPPPWRPASHLVMRWAADELEFVYPHEDIGSEEVIALGVLAETVNSELFVATYNGIINAARRIKQGGMEEEGAAVNACYVIWLIKVLAQFDTLMRDADMQTTAYHQHYIEQESVFENLRSALESVKATQAAALEKSRHSFAEASDNLAAQWRARIKVAAQDFQSPG